MAVGNESAVFFPNNRVPCSPTRGGIKGKPKGFPVSQSRNKLQLDLSSPDQAKGGKPQQGGRGWNNKGRTSPSKVGNYKSPCTSPLSYKSPASSPVGIKSPGSSPGGGGGRSPPGSNSWFYAGFTESPAPGSLPKPPSHWVVPKTMSTGLAPGELSSPSLPLSVKSFLGVRA